MRFVLPVLILSLLFLPACPPMRQAEDPDVEVAKRAAVQIQALREGEAYDALAPDLAERFRRDASRLPASQRNRPVEVLGAALVRKGEGFSEVAVIVRVTPPGVAPLENRAFYRVQNGKVVRVFPAMP
ncbi:MAG: hypothetical protein RMK94_12800 [Armatimonadota bacterium]|nr:hypothetical protein [Armatimonadota bacterium]